MKTSKCLLLLTCVGICWCDIATVISGKCSLDTILFSYELSDFLNFAVTPMMDELIKENLSSTLRLPISIQVLCP